MNLLTIKDSNTEDYYRTFFIKILKANLIYTAFYFLIVNDALLSSLNQRMTSFGALKVVEGYYLVLGGGKFGSDFARYAKEQYFPFVVIVDIDEAAETSNSSVVVEREKLFSLIKTYTESKEKENAYFHCMDVRDIPLILETGIPEYIIPAVPTHALANMAIDLLVQFIPDH